MRNLGIATVIAAAVVLSAGAANAAITVTKDLTYSAPAGETLVEDFDGTTAAGYSWSGTLLTGSGSVTNVRAAPEVVTTSGPGLDATTYGYLTAIDSEATLTIPTSVAGVSVYIGSLDSYNYIGFESGGTTTWFTGTDLAAIAGSSLDGSARYYFDFNGASVDAIIFAAGQNSLEFDNIAAVAVPEASIWILLVLGFGLTGLALRGNRQRNNMARAAC